MAQVINTNIASLNAQRNLTRSQGMLNTSLERLSSGMRINSAKDDAAGLAISERFTAQIRGLNQAVRNSNDGISLSQTAESALSEVTNNLQRIRELAVQSSNATNSASDRKAMQEEVAQLVAEIDRVAKQSNFNGVKLLDGTFSSQAFQVGANVGETISIDSISNSTKAGLKLDDGTATVNSSTKVSGALTAGGLTINGKDVAATSQDAKAMAEAISAVADNVTATAGASDVTLSAFAAHTGNDTGASSTMTITIDGVEISHTAAAGAAITAADMQAALDGISSTNGYINATTTYTGTFSGGDLKITKSDGSTFQVTSTLDNGSGGVDDASGYGTIASITSTGEDLVIGGDEVANAGLTAGTTASSGNTLDVSTVSGANAMITAVDTALDTVNSSRAKLGAVQNRFESVINSLQTASESMSAARSRILDADFAAETAQLTRAQILQQAGTAMLAQANALPQNVLSLLQ